MTESALTLSELHSCLMVPVKVIPLTRDQYAIIDPEDWELVSRYSWCAIQGRSGIWYAQTRLDSSTHTYMHTLITNYDYTDHENGNGLDNRRVNLRHATHEENMWNRRQQRNNTSGHRGISRHKTRGKWQAQISYLGTIFYLGQYDDFSEAVAAYHEKRAKLHGNFAAPCCEEISSAQS
jgi:AP2 domain